MGKGGRGGGRYTPNDDRSRSMNSQDVCGQAAAANEARQRGDDDDWGDYPTDFTAILERELEKTRKPVLAVERLIRPTGEVAIIKWSSVDDRYILTLSDQANFVLLMGVPNAAKGIHVGEVHTVSKILTALGYEVTLQWRPL